MIIIISIIIAMIMIIMIITMTTMIIPNPCMSHHALSTSRDADASLVIASTTVLQKPNEDDEEFYFDGNDGGFKMLTMMVSGDASLVIAPTKAFAKT